MKKYLPFIIILIIGLIALIAYDNSRPKKVKWEETYLQDDKEPYGTFILNQIRDQIFPETQNIDLTASFYEFRNDHAYSMSEDDYGYIMINKDYEADQESVADLMEMVAEGQSAFISAKWISDLLADSLGFEVDYSSYFLLDSGIYYNYTNPKLRFEKDILLPKMYDVFHISRYDTSITEVLGYQMLKDSTYQVNFIKIEFGAGQFLIHTTPQIFTNYYLLRDRGDRSVFAALSYLPDHNFILWDQYNKSGKNVIKSPLRFIFQNPSLKAGFYLLIFTILTYILFFGKRRQRVVEVLPPVRNTTMDFIRTLSMLYYDKANHREIAKKMIQYFQEDLAFKFHVNPQQLSEKDLQFVALKSGVELSKVRFLLTFIRDTQKQHVIDSDTLLLLNSYIQDFHQKSLV